MNELKENFSRLYFSPDEVNEELAISMKSLITKEDFIDILVDRYEQHLKSGKAMTKRYRKSMKYFAEKFRYVIKNIEKYKCIIGSFKTSSSSKKYFPQLHNFARIIGRKSFMKLDLRPIYSHEIDIIIIPFPDDCKIEKSIVLLRNQW
jgi:pyoverdine/dityrosine biosynthesis protein Dit1